MVAIQLEDHQALPTDQQEVLDLQDLLTALLVVQDHLAHLATLVVQVEEQQVEGK